MIVVLEAGLHQAGPSAKQAITDARNNHAGQDHRGAGPTKRRPQNAALGRWRQSCAGWQPRYLEVAEALPIRRALAGLD